MQIMMGFGCAYRQLDCYAREFEDARLRRQLANARQGNPLRLPERQWSPFLFLALKSMGLLQILRLALDGGVQQ
jgi:hypothetical protein